MSVVASEHGGAESGDAYAGVVRDLGGAYAIAGTRWSEALGGAGELLQVFARQPWVLARAEATLTMEWIRIALGRSARRPPPDDHRFDDSAWLDNPAFKRLLQGYLAWSDMLLGVVDNLRIDAGQRARLRFVAEHLIAAAAPRNFFLTHPGFYDNAARTHGASIIAGIRHLLRDLRANRGLPRQVDKSAFRLGVNIAATEGAVIFRDEVFELIQYSPRTATVDARGVLLCPAQINKYYLLDLAPDKSFARYALESGQQVFAISWRNPTAAQSDWGLSTYIEATETAVTVVRSVTGARPVKLVGACAGGVTAAATLARMTARGDQDQIACLSLLATSLTVPRPEHGTNGSGRALGATLLTRSGRVGVLDGAAMARAFAWLRPNDLVWQFVANNYVLGNDPPASEALFWNTDTTRLPARLHADLVAFYAGGARRRSRWVDLGDERIDLSLIERDVFMVAGARDPVMPWQGCYQALGMFRSNVRFVLGAAGHIQTLLCLADDGQACFYVNDDYSLDAASWRRGAREMRGSWWPAWVRWGEAHGGERQPAPAVYGNESFEPIEAAPGRYVRQV